MEEGKRSPFTDTKYQTVKMKRNIERIEKLISNEAPVFSATFVFRVKNYDSEFERLNDLIDQAAETNPGYLGKERWTNNAENKRSVIYYWEEMESLRKFSKHPIHQKAKQNYSKWYEGYEILIAEVLMFKSDHGL